MSCGKIVEEYNGSHQILSIQALFPHSVWMFFPNTKHPDSVWKQFLKPSSGRSAAEASGVSDLPPLQDLVTQSHQNTVFPHKSTVKLPILSCWQVGGGGPAAALPGRLPAPSPARWRADLILSLSHLNGAKTKLGGDQSLLSYHLKPDCKQWKNRAQRVMADQLPMLVWLRCCHRS